MYRSSSTSALQAAEDTRQGSRLRTVRRVAGIALRSPWAPAAIVWLAYGLWLASAFHGGHSARDFIVIGRRFVTQSHVSSVIRLDPAYNYEPYGAGYDGQFTYFIALDPLNARYYLDSGGAHNAGPDYRYTRILYPMLARFLALQRADAIPYTLLLINWLALGAGTLAVAAWLRRRRLSVYFAMIYGLYPGLFVALQRDLNEALAYALVALGVCLYDLGRWKGVVSSSLAFALASLTRETTLVFPILYGIALWPGARLRAEDGESRPEGMGVAGAFTALSIGPFILYKLFLWSWLGTIGRTGGVYPEPIPFGGILAHWPGNTNGIEQLAAVIAPALLCLGMCVWALWRRALTVEVAVLLANILLFVVFLNQKSYAEYFASGRVAVGVVLAALYCLPVFGRLTRWRLWLWLSALLWLSLLPALVSFPRRAFRPADELVVLGLVAALWIATRLTRPPLVTSVRRPSM